MDDIFSILQEGKLTTLNQKVAKNLLQLPRISYKVIVDKTGITFLHKLQNPNNITY